MTRLHLPVVLATGLFASIAVAAFSQTQQPETNTIPMTQPPLDPAAAHLAQLLPMLDEKARQGLAMQVALDRAGFSPGEIDAAPGVNTDRAMTAFVNTHGSTDLGDAYNNPVIAYTVTADDVAGPFIERIPDDMMEMAKLPALGYTSVLELLSERFHASPKLMQRLNPAAKFVEGESILVPNVEPFYVNGKTPQQTADAAPANAKRDTGAPANDATRAGGRIVDPELTVTVTDRSKTLEVRDGAGTIIFHAPVTVGSKNDPLPVGEWIVNGVGRNPTFNYNPELFWDADPSHAKAKVAAGPNNPVGVVWIDLTKEHYGIHGTPEPSRIGYTESHGCIRLTNWDAMRLANLVGKGTRVILR